VIRSVGSQECGREHVVDEQDEHRRIHDGASGGKTHAFGRGRRVIALEYRDQAASGEELDALVDSFFEIFYVV
jgi:hypothetical protein